MGGCDIPAMALTDRQIAALFREHGHLVYRRAYKMLRNQADAEEATQEVFALAIRGRDTTPENPVGWLYTITTRYCLNIIRNRKRRTELFDGHVAEVRHSTAGPASASGLVALQDILSRADAEQAKAAVYVYMDGMTHREAAELMGVSKSSVTNLLDRLKKWVTSS